MFGIVVKMHTHVTLYCFRIVMTKSYRVTEVLAELNSGDKVDDGGRWKSERLEISIERPRIL